MSKTTNKNRILVIGDSLTVGIKDLLVMPHLEICADYGKTLAWGKQWLKPSRVIVYALGTNNPPITWEFGMRRYLRMADEYAPHVVAVTLWRKERSYADLNTKMRADDNYTVADWAHWISRQPAHQGDGTHPDGVGYQARALIFRDAIQRAMA